MITLVKILTVTADANLCELRGLSSDTKPTNVLNGSSFLEIDTGKTFYYDADGEDWIDPTAEADPTAE